MYVNHERDDLRSNRGSCYFHYTDTDTFTAGNIATMQEQNFCNIWDKGSGYNAPDPAQDLRLMNIKTKTKPGVIYSDMIPAGTLTGIEFYDSTEDETSWNTDENLAKEFCIKPIQNITLKGV